MTRFDTTSANKFDTDTLVISMGYGWHTVCNASQQRRQRRELKTKQSGAMRPKEYNMANWIKTVSPRVRISDKSCAELSVGDKRKVFVHIDDVNEVIKQATELKEYLESQEGQTFHVEATESLERARTEEYLRKQELKNAEKELKQLQAMKEQYVRKFGSAAAAPLEVRIQAKMEQIIALSA